jgi:AraC family transcriptional activator FtrA
VPEQHHELGRPRCRADLHLHIVRRDHGAEIANRVTQRLVIALHRDGGQAQSIPQPVRKAEGAALTSV